uniref:ribosomal protein S19 n=1 Tax=Psychotria serpens TaxID=77896 RepID=UPI0022FD9B7C|nr:ribosomal protein S19 [Psychotria serpens]UIG86748.1 ribosomal protein S19 [Psychotria serpens]
MPRRSIWKGSFVDAFLLRMKKKRDFLLNRKIWSRRSSISPPFVDCSVRIYNGKTSVHCNLTSGVNNLESGNEDRRQSIYYDIYKNEKEEIRKEMEFID